MAEANNKFGDIDIDIQNRELILDVIDHTPASIIKESTIERHNTGVYVQKVPTDPITGLASIDYENAEELGYAKLDFLNNNAYENIKDNDHLQKLINQEPMWELLEHEEVVKRLYHIHDHFDIVKKMRPKSIEQLAMVLAIIRPGKRYLLGRSWPEVEKEIWVKSDDKYYFKRSHATSYALLIVMQLNQLAEQAGEA